MSVGLLIIINLLTIPFVYEMETLGAASGNLPKLLEILKLTNFFKTRWFYGYFIILFLLLSLWLAPSRSGSTHVASYRLIGSILIIQLLVWGVVIYRIFNKEGGGENGS